MLAAVLTLLLILSVIIKYPDTITARLSVTGTQPVAEVVARQSGHLESLDARENQKVKKNDVLAVIQSPSRSAVALALKAKLARLAPSVADEVTAFDLEFKPEEGLGRLQDSYADFLGAYNQFRTVLADEYAQKAGQLLRQQIEGKHAQITALRAQQQMSQRELELARVKYDRLKLLHARSSISTAELQEQEMAVLVQMRGDGTTQKNLLSAA